MTRTLFLSNRTEGLQYEKEDRTEGLEYEKYQSKETLYKDEGILGR